MESLHRRQLINPAIPSPSFETRKIGSSTRFYTWHFYHNHDISVLSILFWYLTAFVGLFRRLRALSTLKYSTITHLLVRIYWNYCHFLNPVSFFKTIRSCSRLSRDIVLVYTQSRIEIALSVSKLVVDLNPSFYHNEI